MSDALAHRLKLAVEAISRAQEGERNETLNRWAYLVGGYLATTPGGEQAAHDALLAAAMHCGMNRKEASATIRRSMRQGSDKPAASPANGYRQQPAGRWQAPLPPLEADYTSPPPNRPEIDARFAKCKPIRTGDLVTEYLERRGCRLPQSDEVRLHPTLPMMVCRISHALDEAVSLSLHCTSITPELTRGERTYLKGFSIKGGVIRLDQHVTMGLFLAEGVETALTCPYAPVWACMDSGHLKKFPVLLGLDAITILADHDPAGLKAADECRRRYLGAGLEARVIIPPNQGEDFNDVGRRV